MNLGQPRFGLIVGPRRTHPMWMLHAARKAGLSLQNIKFIDEAPLPIKRRAKD